METLFALLLTEPFALSFEQIAYLTDRQIYDLYFHPRDKTGAIKPKMEPVPEPQAQTKAEKHTLFFAMARKYGIPEAKALETWYQKFPEDRPN